MKHRLLLILGCVICLTGLAPATASASPATEAVRHADQCTSRNLCHRHRRWIPGHYRYRHGRRYWVPGHYRYY